MKYGVLRYLSYMVLVFGFLYISWHMGRAFERDGGAETGVTITTCRDTGVSIDCSSVEVGAEDFGRVYERVMEESRDAEPESVMANPVLEFTKR